jgi:membrane-bound lytic murein transglycosylase D
MAEIRFLVGLVCWRLSFSGTFHGQKIFEHLKLPILGCAIALVAGCGTFTSHQANTLDPSASSRQPGQKTAMQGQSPEPNSPKCELPVPDHPSIDAWVERFSREKHKSFQTQLERARFYVVPAQEVFERQGLPADLVFVALVESGFSPTARSHANAVGMWQFISATGKRFGLEQGRWIDERRHPLKAARAAADYLSFLYDRFESWPLALAAYNAGERAVQETLDRSGFKTFWELAENGYLPAETRDYVPKVFAAVKIIRDPRHYGFYFDSKHYVQPHETVSIPGGVKLSWIGQHIGIPEASLQNCNPELCESVTPPGCSSYELCVPIGKGQDVVAALAEHPLREEKRERKTVAAPSNATPASYKARPGDSWFGLASKYKCSVKTLAALNGANPSKPLKAGQTLKIPAGGSPIALAAVQRKENKDRVSASGPGKNKPSSAGQKPGQPLYYPVRQGDTLWSIAERFRISVKTICAHNELSPNQKLIPGNLLTIYASQQNSVRATKRTRL